MTADSKSKGGPDRIRVTRLRNGITVVTESDPGSATMSVGITARVGARHEREEVNGISHFVEHMLFKGTANRDVHSLARETEDEGLAMNAFTSDEQTTYLMSGLAESREKALELLSDMVRDAAFPEQELDRERNVILQEIARAEDNPSAQLINTLKATAYAGQPLGRTVLGPADNIRAMPREAFQRHLREHYSAGNLIVAASGDVDHDSVVAQVERELGALPRSRPQAPQGARYVGGEAQAVMDNRSQTHVALALPQPGESDPQATTYEVLAEALGGGMSSRMFREIREQRGLVYAVQAGNFTQTDSGLFFVIGGTTPDKVREFVETAADQLRQAADDLTQAELDRAKKSLRAELALSQQGVSSRRRQLEDSILSRGQPETPEQRLAAIDAVTLDDAKAALRTMLDKKPTLVTAGAKADPVPLAELESRLRGGGGPSPAKSGDKEARPAASAM